MRSLGLLLVVAGGAFLGYRGVTAADGAVDNRPAAARQLPPPPTLAGAATVTCGLILVTAAGRRSTIDPGAG